VLSALSRQVGRKRRTRLIMLSHHDVFGSDSDSDNEVDADASRSPGAATTASDRRADEIISRGEELLAKLAAGENSPSEVSESNQELDQEKSNAEEDGEEEESSDGSDDNEDEDEDEAKPHDEEDKEEESKVIGAAAKQEKAGSGGEEEEEVGGKEEEEEAGEEEEEEGAMTLNAVRMRLSCALRPTLQALRRCRQPRRRTRGHHTHTRTCTLSQTSPGRLSDLPVE
jgi:hypothetical protein